MDELRARAFLDLRPRQGLPAPRPPGRRHHGHRRAGRRHGAAASRRGSGRRRAAAGSPGRSTLTVPLGTVTGRADRPGELAGLGPVDPWLARDLAAAAARNPKTTWCVTVTDEHGHAVGHGCARPEPREPPANAPDPARRAGPGSASPRPAGTARPADTAPGGCAPRAAGRTGSSRSTPWTPATASTGTRARGHDPGVRLRHLSQVRHATCTSPVCRRPAAQCDFEHNTPYEAGGRTCLCNGGPKCRHDHRLKQQPGWTVDQLPDGTFRWTTPAGRSYDTEPTRYPI